MAMEAHLRSLNILTEEISIPPVPMTEINYEQEILNYLNELNKNTTNLLRRAEKLNMSVGDVQDLKARKVDFKNDKRVNYKLKTSILPKGIQVYNTAIALHKKLKSLFRSYEEAVKGKDPKEQEDITQRFSASLIPFLRSARTDFSMRDVHGHLLQASKMALIKFLGEAGIDVPVYYKAEYGSNTDLANAVKSAKLNPEYPLDMLFNFVALQTLNDEVKKGNVSKENYPKLIRSILNTDGIVNKVVSYINDTKFGDVLDSIDVKSGLSKKHQKALKSDQLNISPDTTYSAGKEQTKSLVNKLAETDLEKVSESLKKILNS